MVSASHDNANAWLWGATVVLAIQCAWASVAAGPGGLEGTPTVDIARYYDAGSSGAESSAQRRLLQTGVGLSAPELMAQEAKYPCKDLCSGHGKCRSLQKLLPPMTETTIHGTALDPRPPPHLPLDAPHQSLTLVFTTVAAYATTLLGEGLGVVRCVPRQ